MSIVFAKKNLALSPTQNDPTKYTTILRAWTHTKNACLAGGSVPLRMKNKCPSTMYMMSLYIKDAL